MEETSIGHHRYVLCFVDNATKYAEVYYLKSKSSEEVHDNLKRFQTEYAKYLEWNDGKVLKWHTDNGGEFESSDVQEFCQRLVIEHTRSVPYRPEGNSLSERLWGMLLKPARILLQQSGVHHRFWTYCMEHVKHLHNRMPTEGLLGFVSPHFQLFGEHPDFTRLRVWGCKCYFHLEQSDKLFKLDPTSVEAVNLGEDFERKAHHVYIPSLNRITTATVSF